MASILTLTATSGTEEVSGAAVSVTVASNDEVKIVVAAPAGITVNRVGVFHKGEEIDTFLTVDQSTDSGVKLAGSIKIDSEEKAGKYTFTLGDGTDEATLDLKIEEDKTEEPPTPDPKVVLEIEPGEYDRGFTIVTGIVTAVLLTGILGGTLCLVKGAGITPATTALKSGEWQPGTLSELAASRALYAIVGAGAALLVIGAWLAALETRGRLLVKATAGVTGEENQRRVKSLIENGISDTLAKSVNAVVESLKTARGTIAVLVAGGLILIVALFTSANTADNSHGPAIPDPSPTSDTGGTGTGGEPGADATGTPTPRDEPTKLPPRP